MPKKCDHEICNMPVSEAANITIDQLKQVVACLKERHLIELVGYEDGKPVYKPGKEN